MNFLDTLLADLRFRVVALSLPDLLDILLVSYIFYVLIVFLRHTRAAVLIRGVLYLVLALAFFNIILPLPTLGWVIGATVLTLMIATPITLQSELRRALEQLGNFTPFSFRKQSAFELQAKALGNTLQQLAESYTGALLVLRGRDGLDDYIATGVTIDGSLSVELLRTLFFDKTPLHDGAVIVEEGRIVAAGCVLPLTQQELTNHGRRLGTRHRAATGLSEHCDALVLVVSEETGQISIAQSGRLQSSLSYEEITSKVEQFFQQPAGQKGIFPLNLSRSFVLSTAGSALLAMLFALFAWVAVTNQTNPLEQATFESVTLRVNAAPADMQFVVDPPQTVTIEIRTTQAVMETLSAASFQATLDLSEIGPGLHQVPVQTQASVANVQLLNVYPRAIDIVLEPIVEQSLPIAVSVIDEELLPVVFQRVGQPILVTTDVVMRGPMSTVAQVTSVTAELSVANATTTIRRRTVLVARDSNGVEVTGLTLTPATIEISQFIGRRQDIRELAINTVTTGLPAAGYWLSSLSVTPNAVTLQGDPTVLQALNNFVNTLPVDIASAYGNSELSVPLDLPAGTRAFDENGLPLTNVVVFIGVSSRQGDLLLSLPLEIQNLGDLNIELGTRTVDILLSGPLPTIWAIEAEPNLVHAIIDVHGLPLNQQLTIAPTVIIPEDLRYQLINSVVTILITP